MAGMAPASAAGRRPMAGGAGGGPGCVERVGCRLARRLRRKGGGCGEARRGGLRWSALQAVRVRCGRLLSAAFAREWVGGCGAEAVSGQYRRGLRRFEGAVAQAGVRDLGKRRGEGARWPPGCVNRVKIGQKPFGGPPSGCVSRRRPAEEPAAGGGGGGGSRLRTGLPDWWALAPRTPDRRVGRTKAGGFLVDFGAVYATLAARWRGLSFATWGNVGARVPEGARAA